MLLYQIRPLLRDMGLNQVKQDKFSFEYNRVKFDVIVLIDRRPFELLFGIIDRNFCFTLKLREHFEVENLPDNVFYKLCSILNLKAGKEGLTSQKFLWYFATKIPLQYSGKKLQPHEIAIYKTSKIDENKKIFFKGWMLHNIDGREARNLEKTRQLLGEEAYQYCKEHNISSCWSANPGKRHDYYTPQEYWKSL